MGWIVIVLVTLGLCLIVAGMIIVDGFISRWREPRESINIDFVSLKEKERDMRYFGG